MKTILILAAVAGAALCASCGSSPDSVIPPAPPVSVSYGGK